MSGKINTKFAVREMKIMEDCLKKLGFAYSKEGEHLVIARAYNDIVISEDGISCDTVNHGEVEQIQFEYGKEFAIQGVEQRGEMYEMEETKDELILYVN